MPKYTCFGELIISRMTIDKFVKRLNEYYGNEKGSGRLVAGFFGCESLAKSPDFSNFLIELEELKKTIDQKQDEKSNEIEEQIRFHKKPVMSQKTIDSIRDLINTSRLEANNKAGASATLRTLAYGLDILKDIETLHIEYEKARASQLQQQQSESTGTDEGVEPTPAAPAQQQYDDVELTCAAPALTFEATDSMFQSILKPVQSESGEDVSDVDLIVSEDDGFDILDALDGLSSSTPSKL